MEMGASRGSILGVGVGLGFDWGSSLGERKVVMGASRWGWLPLGLVKGGVWGKGRQLLPLSWVLRVLLPRQKLGWGWGVFYSSHPAHLPSLLLWCP